MNFLSKVVKRLNFTWETKMRPMFDHSSTDYTAKLESGIRSTTRKAQAAKLESEVLEYDYSTGLVSWACNNMKRQPTELKMEIKFHNLNISSAKKHVYQ